MKKRKSIGLWVGICLLFLGIFGSVNVFAAVTEGKAGEILTGEYAVIINTDTSDSRSAGTLIFDDSGSTASVSSGSELPAAQSLAGLNAGSTGSVTALNEKSAISSTASADETDDGISVQAATTTYAIGEEKYIYRSNGSGKTYICIGIGEHCYIWMTLLSLHKPSKPARRFWAARTVMYPAFYREFHGAAALLLLLFPPYCGPGLYCRKESVPS